MMTVKVGELINQLRNTTVFGMLLCAIWILASFNLEVSRSQRLWIQDYLVYLVLQDSISKATDDGGSLKACLRDARIGAPCRFVMYHQWLGKTIYLDAIRLDVDQLIYSNTGIRWKSDKVIFDFDLPRWKAGPPGLSLPSFELRARQEINARSRG
jgi:hypothetical protein